ncbi:integrase arm-type DNA-binding domain-containing protein [Rhizobium sp. RAF56]|uniref:integrase arm-type DNA-binding domain-containing protein n=1 Tax=Rhizobium sp. RAF56 TaxID=3233062 RepID=UPI003F989922
MARSDLKPNHYSDGLGLYLQSANGTRRRGSSAIRSTAKPVYMGLGSAAVSTLAEALVRACDAKKLIADGIDPLTEKTAKKAAARTPAASPATFRHSRLQRAARRPRGNVDVRQAERLVGEQSRRCGAGVIAGRRPLLGASPAKPRTSRRSGLCK